MKATAVLWKRLLWVTGSLSVLALAQVGTATQSEEIRSWAISSYPAALDRVLSLDRGTRDPDQFPDHIEWRATVRVWQPGTPELRVRIEKPWDQQDQISLEASEVVGGDVLQQLEVLRLRYPASTLEQIASRVQVRSWTIAGNACPRLAAIAARLPRLTVAAVPGTDIVLDAPRYDLQVETRSADMLLHLVGDGSVNSEAHEWVSRLAEGARSLCARTA